MLTDIGQWREAARAHAQRFAQVRPACTFVEVSGFIDPGWLVEFELDAIILDSGPAGSRRQLSDPRPSRSRRFPPRFSASFSMAT